MSEENKIVLEEETTQEEETTMEALLHDPNQPIVTMKRLLDARVHFGHQTRRWNPKMGRYIYGNRHGIYIIDLSKTLECINEAYTALKEIVADSGKVLFVGTKELSQELIVSEATRSGSFYVVNRWLGGTLTNFKTIESRIRYLKQLESDDSDGVLDRLPKKEAILLRKEKAKLATTLAGIKEMRRLPQALVVVNSETEHIAIKEARKLKIPVFGIVDTNSDPDLIDYPIPANDDAPSSIQLIINLLADAVVEAKGGDPIVAYLKDDEEEVTMKDAVRLADKENAERLARIRAQRRARREHYERQQALRAKRQRYQVKEEVSEEEDEGLEVEESVEEKPKKKALPKKETVVKKEADVIVEEEVVENQKLKK
jgi:small subunit ribosomal protein S2